MFSFVNPLFLWAAAAALVPLILHLMQTSRTVRLPFSTIRFLKLAEQKSSRRIRMQHFLLWLLRTLLLLVLSLAFAVPMLRTRAFGSFLSRAQRDVAIVLDHSYSMAYGTSKGTVWEKALDAAVSVVQGLAEGDRVCIYLADDDVTPLVEQMTADRDFAVAQLKALKVGGTPSQLAPATLAAYGALKQEARRREQEIHIITDNQALPWNSFTRSGPSEPQKAGSGEGAAETASAPPDRWDPSRIDKRTAFFVTLAGVASPENAAPRDIELTPPLILSDVAAKVTVRLLCSGPVRNSSATLFIDDKESGNRAVTLGDGQSGDVTFAIPPLRAGTHSARVETPADNLPPDNAFHFLIHVQDRLPCLCVGSPDDVLFLTKALTASPSKSSMVEIKRIDPEQVAEEKLSGYSCIFLCNAIPLPGQGLVALENAIRERGLLAVFPGPRATAGDYKAWSILPAVPSEIRDVGVSARKRMLRWEQPRYPLLQTLPLRAGTAPLVAIQRELIWTDLPKNAEVLISAGADTPFLLTRRAGRGEVLLFSVSADRSWSDFPLCPYYLPIAHQIVQYAAGVGGAPPFVWATRGLSLQNALPEATRDTVLLDPDGKAVDIRSSVADNQTLFSIEGLLIPGLYRLAPGEGKDTAPALAVNLDRTESDLTPVKAESLSETTGIENLRVATDKQDLMRLIADHRIGKTLGEHLLWLALLLSIVESVYANVLSRANPKLSEALGIEASGKVQGAK